jgi:hypothetical protein
MDTQQLLNVPLQLGRGAALPLRAEDSASEDERGNPKRSARGTALVRLRRGGFVLKLEAKWESETVVLDGSYLA